MRRLTRILAGAIPFLKIGEHVVVHAMEGADEVLLAVSINVGAEAAPRAAHKH